METNALITLLAQNQDGGASVNDAITRAKWLRNLQSIFNLVVNDRNWQFRYGNGQITFQPTAGGVATTAFLPADFLTWGPHGGLFQANRPGQNLEWQPLFNYLRLLEIQGQTGSEPHFYTELGTSFGGSSPGDGSRQIAVYPSLTVAVVCDCQYFRVPPILADSADHNLNYVPPTWHLTVLYEGAVWMSMKDSANIQARTEQQALYDKHLKTMRNEERGGKQALHRLRGFNPSHGRRMGR